MSLNKSSKGSILLCCFKVKG
ncbi:2,3-dihydro-2,3-dihydroxybenzoate dehydrogenase, partial [Salmonella enterica]|nr:2,3-dihydro-2,3-dihydroxybenzoate dehydrogenase [Salmonella enterica]